MSRRRSKTSRTSSKGSDDLGYVDIAREYIIYRHERARVRAARAPKFDVTDNIPYRIIYNVLRWNLDHDCHSVAGAQPPRAHRPFPRAGGCVGPALRPRHRNGRRHHPRPTGELRIVIVAGPSSSGKTTTTIKISECLARAGIGFKAINIDHYFFNLDEHPKDEFGDYDYETPQALDLELINRHLVQLLERTVHPDAALRFQDRQAHVGCSSLRAEAEGAAADRQLARPVRPHDRQHPRIEQVQTLHRNARPTANRKRRDDALGR